MGKGIIIDKPAMNASATDLNNDAANGPPGGTATAPPAADTNMNIALAVNYSLHDMDNYAADSGAPVRTPSSFHGSTTNSDVELNGGMIIARLGLGSARLGLAGGALLNGDVDTTGDQSGMDHDRTRNDTISTRRPKRKRTPKKAAVEKTMVRYLMGNTPAVRRNRGFLHAWRVGEAATPGNCRSSSPVPDGDGTPPTNQGNAAASGVGGVGKGGQAQAQSASSTPQRASKRLRRKKEPETNFNTETGVNGKSKTGASSASGSGGTPPVHCDSCRHFPFCSLAHPELHHSVNEHPFLDDESVVWVPSSRSEWEDCIDELTAVCTEAARRRHAAESAAWRAAELSGGAQQGGGGEATRGRGRPRGKPGLKPPSPPLSRDYIRDRIDIDDPIRGYQIRHASLGYLQGFVLTTTFTTWTHYFKWDSTHPKSGMRGAMNAMDAVDSKSSKLGKGMGKGIKKAGWDHGGILSAELEKQPRGGDPNHGGVIWPTIAEVSVVGALGCGEYLLRMALDDILRRDCYDYVVLQATDSSRTFYERFGFVRVGAVSKYGSAEAVSGTDRPAQQKAGPSVPVVGYRHWTYADESSHRLSKHGGPSYMMAVRVGRTRRDPNGEGHHCAECARAIGRLSFLDALSDCFVRDKPEIQPTPGLLGRKGKVLTADAAAASGGGAKPVPKPKAAPVRKKAFDKPPVTPTHSAKRRGSSSGAVEPNTAVQAKNMDKAATHRWTSLPNSAVGAKEVATPGKRRPPRQRGGKNSNLPTTLTTPPPAPAAAKRDRNRDTRSAPNPSVEALIETIPPKKNSPLNRTKCPNLRKQRIPAMYRDPSKVYYYNKVVTPKATSGLRSSSKPYYFVLHYDEAGKTMRIIPLVAKGMFENGKRAGRVRWKATASEAGAAAIADELHAAKNGGNSKGGGHNNREDHLRRFLEAVGVVTVPCEDWAIVPADATNKGTGVAEESWDIFDS